jgi:hypothetical protein
MVDLFKNLDSLKRLGKLEALLGYSTFICCRATNWLNTMDLVQMDRNPLLLGCWTGLQLSTTPSHTNCRV